MQRFSIFLILSGLLFASCVPNRKIVYLQKGDELREDVRLDTVIRNYNQDANKYRIQKDDILSVRFSSLTKEEYDFLSTENESQQNNSASTVQISGYLVDGNGDIEFPVIGKIHVKGLTIPEIQAKLQQVTKGLLSNPVIRVRLMNFRVTILGEVVSEGLVTIPNNEVTIYELIGRAGGLTDLANRERIKLIRKYDNTSAIIYLNLLDEEFLKSGYLYLQNNDILIVEPLKQRPFRKYFGSNLSLVVTSVSVFLLTINLIR